MKLLTQKPDDQSKCRELALFYPRHMHEQKIRHHCWQDEINWSGTRLGDAMTKSAVLRTVSTEVLRSNCVCCLEEWRVKSCKSCRSINIRLMPTKVGSGSRYAALSYTTEGHDLWWCRHHFHPGRQAGRHSEHHMPTPSKNRGVGEFHATMTAASTLELHVHSLDESKENHHLGVWW